jgi:hypothetical protein
MIANSECYRHVAYSEIRQTLTLHINLYFPIAGISLIIRYVSLNIVGKKFLFLTTSPGLQPRTVFGSVTFASVISPPNQTILFLFHSSIVLSYLATESKFTGTRNKDRFPGLWPLPCNILVETNNFGLGAILLQCLVSELQKPPSLGLELRTLRVLNFPNLFLETRHQHARFCRNWFPVLEL